MLQNVKIFLHGIKFMVNSYKKCSCFSFSKSYVNIKDMLSSGKQLIFVINLDIELKYLFQ